MLMLMKATRLAHAEALIAALAPLDDISCRLYTNDHEPTVNSVIGDFTQATFTGYAAEDPVVWGVPFLDINRNAVCLGGLIEFQSSAGNVIAENVYGYYLLTTGGALLGAERFDAPVAITGGNQAVPVVPRYQYGQ